VSQNFKQPLKGRGMADLDDDYMMHDENVAPFKAVAAPKAVRGPFLVALASTVSPTPTLREGGVPQGEGAWYGGAGTHCVDQYACRGARSGCRGRA
jgi:hypothetical protein